MFFNQYLPIEFTMFARVFESDFFSPIVANATEIIRFLKTFKIQGVFRKKKGFVDGKLEIRLNSLKVNIAVECVSNEIISCNSLF